MGVLHNKVLPFVVQVVCGSVCGLDKNKLVLSFCFNIALFFHNLLSM